MHPNLATPQRQGPGVGEGGTKIYRWRPSDYQKCRKIRHRFFSQHTYYYDDHVHLMCSLVTCSQFPNYYCCTMYAQWVYINIMFLFIQIIIKLGGKHPTPSPILLKLNTYKAMYNNRGEFESVIIVLMRTKIIMHLSTIMTFWIQASNFSKFSTQLCFKTPFSLFKKKIFI